MATPRVALAANDTRLADAIRNHLKSATGQSVLTCPIDVVRRRLGSDSDGLLLVAASQAADAEEIVRLVQEVSLQEFPAIILVVEGAGAGADLSDLDRYVAGRLEWPAEADALAELVRNESGRGQAIPAGDDEPLERSIDRRLLSRTPSLRGLAGPVALAAAHDVAVLLTGETGTGKTYLARLMHECSPRRKHRFLVVSCGALSANLIESEFFGHVKGAFTGADQAKEGKFAAAGDGTILLDEIDTLGLEQQANLLRVLETGEYEPVGSNQTRICTARIIAASNWDLEEAVQSGKFRQDLYYRLNVMAFHLPPLRERPQDVGPLARAMVAKFNSKFKKGLFAISPAAMQALEAYPWPGNIRQLENVVQHAVLVSRGEELLPEHLPSAVLHHAGRVEAPVGANGDTLAERREEAERLLISRTLASCRHSRTDAAHTLGISRVTLYKKMKKYGLMTDKRAASRAF